MILFVTLLLVYLLDCKLPRAGSLCALPVPGASRKYLRHEFLDQVAVSSHRLAGSLGTAQRQGLRGEAFLKSSAGGGQSRRWEMRL